MSEPEQREDAIFRAVLRLPPQERTAYLERVCGEDAELRQKVAEALLGAQKEGGATLQPGCGPPTAAPFPSSAERGERPGDWIGHYKLIEPIGEGGMGSVWVAEQSQPVRREVAIKVIKLGMDTRQVIARFEAERQALALMDHPNIAKVLDAGTTKTGRPYFVMERIKGIPITKYCDEKKLQNRQRLDLFIQVCQAIQHAHQKGIIHRDIKPSNILVVEPAPQSEGKLVPKVIDFGIAKATGGQVLTDKSIHTMLAEFVGTPAYMSPEQAEMGALDIDTRSDIYSLGVLLYELLTGRTPFDAQRLASAGLEGIRRIIREEEPPRPSTRLSTLDATEQTTVARRRQTEPPKLLHMVRGDLDWIVLKTLEKDRSRRYETANGLARDIQRHLDSEPVAARPPSQIYRVQKFVRRNKLAFVAGAAIALALAAGGVASTWLALRARRAERDQRRLTEEAQKARASEARQRQQAEEAGAHARAALRQMRLQKVEDLFATEKTGAALAYLANVLREDPSNGVALNRIVSALTYRNFAMLEFEPYRNSWRGHRIRFSPDGLCLLKTVGPAERGDCQIIDSRTGRALSPVLQNGASVTSSDFSPDGRLLAIGTEKIVNIWTLGSGGKAAQFQGHSNWVYTVRFSSDSKRLVTGAGDHTARIWDLESRTSVALLHTNIVGVAEFSHDGRWIVTAGATGDSGKVWNARTGEPVARLDHSGGIRVALFSPDDQRIVTASADGTAKVWHSPDGILIAALQHKSEVWDASFSPAGDKVLTCSMDKTARLWDAASGKPLGQALFHANEISTAEFSPDGQVAVTSSLDTSIALWDLRTYQRIVEPIRHQDFGRMASISADGTRLVTGSSDLGVGVWDVRSGRALPLEFSLEDGVVLGPSAASARFAEFDPSGEKVVILANDSIARLYETRTCRQIPVEFSHAQRVLSAMFSPDGRRLVTTSIDKTARLWDVATGQALTKPLDHQDVVKYAEFSPDGALVVTAAYDGTARIWNATTGDAMGPPLRHNTKPRRSGADPKKVLAAHFSPDGGKVVTAAWDHTAQLWDVQTSKPLGEPMRHAWWVWNACFSADGKRIATISQDKTARVWDAATSKPITAALIHEDLPTCAQFSPDGKYLLTAANDKAARIWDATSGALVTEPLRHAGKVTAAQFSPDGQTVLTGSSDGTFRLWETQSGLPMSEAMRHGPEVLTAQFSPDGKRILTVSSDNSIRIWESQIYAGAAPGWLAPLAEAMGGQRLDDRGMTVTVSFGEIVELKKQILEHQPHDFYRIWAEWFFADRGTRTISPLSDFPLSEHVKNLIQKNSFGTLQEAVRLSPTNALALAGYTMALRKEGTNTSAAELQFLARRAVGLAPDSLGVKRTCAELLAADSIAASHGVQASKLINAVVPTPPDVIRNTNSAHQAIVLGQAKAAAQLPRRDPRTPPELVDLSRYYNADPATGWTDGDPANTLSALSNGEQTLAGVKFDVRALIQLSCSKTISKAFPARVNDIQVGLSCRRLHFLHGASVSYGTTNGVEIGQITIHQTGLAPETIPIRFGLDVRDWQVHPKQRPIGKDYATIAWSGTNATGQALQLFKTTWENPKPEVLVQSLDYTSTQSTAAPFLIAITAE